MTMLNFWLHAFVEPDQYPKNYRWSIEAMDWLTWAQYAFNHCTVKEDGQEDTLRVTCDLDQQDDTYDPDLLIDAMKDVVEAIFDVFDEAGDHVAQYTVAIWKNTASYNVIAGSNEPTKTELVWNFKHRVVHKMEF